ncbi:unannotated protein [freshwater metagenome]|jgi:hypothetical protein|uniref:Unannotated protein n=1 Tax=freshwater metagenome TaxID=449393 RepID=A0A6J7ENF0_9ZZZZ|nr:hypothetical protein [Actinomycetota bacterium]
MKVLSMKPGEQSENDDEMDLINSEFESLVAGLNLDQSSPRTYLDELEDFARSENSEIYQPPVVRRGIHGTFTHILKSISRWWNKPNRNDGDGAVV